MVPDVKSHQNQNEIANVSFPILLFLKGEICHAEMLIDKFAFQLKMHDQFFGPFFSLGQVSKIDTFLSLPEIRSASNYCHTHHTQSV